MISIFFIINAVEAFLLAVYLMVVGSLPGERAFMNLSVSRMEVIAVILLIGIGFVYLTVKAWSVNSRLRKNIRKTFQKEGMVWIAFLIGLALVVAMYFILTREKAKFMNYETIYNRLEPVFVWLTLVGIQISLFAALWYCANFLNYDRSPEPSFSSSELPILLGVFGIFVVLKILLITSNSFGPLGSGDEMTYYDMTDSFYRGFFSIVQSHHYPPLYPLAILPALVFKTYAFEAIKVLNALYSSSVIFPAYFLARHFLGRRNSLIAVVLTCLTPYHLVFPRRILSENLYFPLFIWTVLITFTLPRNKRFRLPWDLLNGAMLSVIYLTRFISLAAIPCFLLAWWVKPFDGERSFFKPGWKKIGYLAGLGITMLAVFSPWLLAGLRDGLALKLILGFEVASKTNPAQLTMVNLLIWVVLYSCYYLIVAAPVLNLLLASFTQIDFQKWREGLGRLVFQIVVLMGGFFVAVIRHSWRAYYNSEKPSKIMGRYLIVYSVLYIIIAVIVAAHFDRSRIKSKVKFIFWTGIFPFILTFIAYSILINGAVIRTDGNLLKALGSVDGFLTETLGPLFFVLLAFLYGVGTYLLLADRRKYLLPFLSVGLMVYYLTGYPSYNELLYSYQTYPWLAEQITEIIREEKGAFIKPDKISVFLPPQHESEDMVEIYNGLRVRGIDNSEMLTYSVDPLDKRTYPMGFVIRQYDSPQQVKSGVRIYEFDGRYFTIREVDR